MTDLPDPGTDPIPEGGDEPYGFWATLFGIPLLERRLLKRIEQLIAVSETDKQALMEALTESRSTDVRVDAIQPENPDQRPRTHTGHRDGNPGASSKGKKP